MQNYSISVILPMYNEEENVGTVILNLDAFLKQIFRNYEIIAVESGSTDNTAKIVDELAKKNKKVKVFHQKTKRGLGNAIRLGFNKSIYDLIWYIDVDDPFDIEELTKALPLIKCADAVIGYRTGERESFKRKVYSKVYNLLIRILFGLKVRDVNFSFKLLKKHVFEKIDLKSDGWFIDAEILIEMKKHKYKIKELPIPYSQRSKGTSVVNLGPNVVFGILKEIFQYIKRNNFVIIS